MKIHSFFFFLVQRKHLAYKNLDEEQSIIKYYCDVYDT